MMAMKPDRKRIIRAWEGRISGCQLGKPVEILAHVYGLDGLTAYLAKAGALPLRDYIPYIEDPMVDLWGKGSCKGNFTRSEPDDDINYSVLALMMLEKHGADLKTGDVAMAWLNLLPAGRTFTAERAAYKTLLSITDELTSSIGFPEGFDFSQCSDNEFSDWIGAQIRADLYGWVCPGNPELAAWLATQDARLSHRGDGIFGAAFIAALGAAIPATNSFDDAVLAALEFIPKESGAAEAVRFGRSIAGKNNAVAMLHEKYAGVPIVHVLNNLAVVVWGLLSSPDDFSAAIGDTVAAGLDTDCNGATVGGLWGLSGRPIPEYWTKPWNGKVVVDLAGVGELELMNLVDRTLSVAEKIYSNQI
jgi:ADP-ribosylglycohydrolase